MYVCCMFKCHMCTYTTTRLESVKWIKPFLLKPHNCIHWTDQKNRLNTRRCPPQNLEVQVFTFRLLHNSCPHASVIHFMDTWCIPETRNNYILKTHLITFLWKATWAPFNYRISHCEHHCQCSLIKILKIFFCMHYLKCKELLRQSDIENSAATKHNIMTT